MYVYIYIFILYIHIYMITQVKYIDPLKDHVILEVGRYAKALRSLAVACVLFLLNDEPASRGEFRRRVPTEMLFQAYTSA